MQQKRVDLHLHTNASDGSWGVDQLLKIIKEKNISIFSITDHDSIENVKSMQNKLSNPDFRFIPGVEISATLNNKEYHIAAYCYDFENKKLNSILNFNRKVRIDFNRDIIKYFEVEYEQKLINEYYEYQHNSNRGGWKSLNFLIDKGLVKNLGDFFRKIHAMNKEMEFISPREVIDVIHDAGGYAFLAHPASYFSGDLLEINFMKEWLKFGIDGIEVYSPYLNNLNDAEHYIEFCNNHKLMFSSGSDCHGDFIKERKVGKPEVYLSDLMIDDLLKQEKGK